MQIVHAGRALRVITTREFVKFVQQRGRLASALLAVLGYDPQRGMFRRTVQPA